MSRGFVKEEDQEESPIIPPRAALPFNVPNLVTENGLVQLKQEKHDILEALKNVEGESEKEKRFQSNLLNGKLNLLMDRINTAKVVRLKDQPQNEVRFGATVSFFIKEGPQKGKKRTFQLVGVDEANIKQFKIAFVAPIARALMGKKVGEEVAFTLGSTIQMLHLEKILY